MPWRSGYSLQHGLINQWVDYAMNMAIIKKVTIECFRLRGILSRWQGYGLAVHGNKEQGQFIDDRIELMAENYYHFPPPTHVGALVVINLCNCVLAIPARKRLSCLQVLRLSNVDLNGQAGDLLKIGPSLETLDIKSSRNIKHLQIISIFKLKNVVLGFQNEAYTYNIKAINLLTLHLNEIPQFFEMPILGEVVYFRNLKELSLCATYHTFFTNQIIETLISKFPYLKELALLHNMSTGHSTSFTNSSAS
ncbi:hypothetical protein ACFX1X_025195 [Malus domestica]|uniref:FBD domain-containing protein n=1 Tax=Malus domestica TaxID=3750 RepID=A0A498H7I2_MALDO|nr:hypothetical protein DVH24_027436 [Malus domestica]